MPKKRTCPFMSRGANHRLCNSTCALYNETSKQCIFHAIVDQLYNIADQLHNLSGKM